MILHGIEATFMPCNSGSFKQIDAVISPLYLNALDGLLDNLFSSWLVHRD